MKNLLKNIGPGSLVAAAFIGPGTITVCTLAGVHYQCMMLWALLLSIVATIVLQEMAARLGLVSGMGLAAMVKNQIPSKPLRFSAIFLILSAILIGNAAYEAGNISGGVMGLLPFFGELSSNYLSFGIGGIAFLLLYLGNYKYIERFLILLVLLMSGSFLITAIMTAPNITSILKGLFIPKVPEGGWLTIIALVGTTIVPYNLFLHASLVKEKWTDKKQLKKVRIDTYSSILVGGLVSMAIVICAAAIGQGQVNNALDLAKGLEPLYGSFSKYFLSLGLFAAGISSAITAPLAAGYVARECFGWEKNLKSPKFRIVWMVILVLGVMVSTTGWKPIEIIKFAQITNALLLPVIAAFLLWSANKSRILGIHSNTLIQNVVGILIILLTLLLGIRGLDKVFGFL